MGCGMTTASDVIHPFHPSCIQIFPDLNMILAEARLNLFSSFCVLALKRTDSSSDSNRRKDSTVSKVSDHEAKVEVRAEDMDGGGSGGERATSAASAVPESPLFDVPGEEDELEESMPWLKVVARVANGFNFCCTHQGFCHPSCFRRQMRASRRIMVAARRVSDTSDTLPSFGRKVGGTNTWKDEI